MEFTKMRSLYKIEDIYAKQSQDDSAQNKGMGSIYNVLGLRISIPQGNPLGIGVTASLPSSQTQSIDSVDYVGNFIYEKGQLKRYMFDDGYLKLYTNTFSPRFFIKDHLGNNRIVTDGSGNIQQNTNYYPYGGMTYISTNQGEQQFKYNGKEYDPMHGLNEYDYGARHYDPAIGKFTTMDPLCEKYYHISPYAYCGGNPVNYIDPNGDSIIVKIGENIELLYENHTLYNKDGSLYIGENEFIKKVAKALQTIYGTSIGKNLIDELSGSRNLFKIEEYSNSHFNSRILDIINYSRTSNEIPNSGGGIIKWNPDGTWLFTEDDLQKNPVSDLAHELFHAFDANNGILLDDNMIYDNLSINEWQACYNENIFRKQMKLPLRTYYNTAPDGMGGIIPLSPYLLKHAKPWKPK